MLSDIQLNVANNPVMLSVIMLNVIMLNVVMLSVIRLSVMVPQEDSYFYSFLFVML